MIATGSKAAEELKSDAALHKDNARFAGEVKGALNNWLKKFPNAAYAKKALGKINEIENKIHGALSIKDPAERAAKIKGLEKTYKDVVMDASFLTPDDFGDSSKDKKSTSVDPRVSRTPY